VTFELEDGTRLESGLVMFPAGHARNREHDLPGILETKFRRLAALATPDPEVLLDRLATMGSADADQLADLYDIPLLSEMGTPDRTFS
jgi:2-methylcitrate dehydratase